MRGPHSTPSPLGLSFCGSDIWMDVRNGTDNEVSLIYRPFSGTTACIAPNGKIPSALVLVCWFSACVCACVCVYRVRVVCIEFA